MSETETIQHSTRPVTIKSLVQEFETLGVEKGSVLLVHSSLSALGWVCGGASAVIEALQTVLSPTGTLVMPAFSTGLSEPSHWVNPPVPEEWWPIIRSEMPGFDPQRTPTRAMGAIAESFRTYPNVLRSRHPLHSFAARGPLANEITANHGLDCGLGETSPLAKLYENRASVLLLGVGHSNNTSLHLSEYRGLGNRLKFIDSGGPVIEDAKRVWKEFPVGDLDSDDFAALGSEFDRKTGLIQSGPIGMSVSHLMPQRELVDFGATWLSENRSP